MAIGCVSLGAGQSKRMGCAKQLLTYQGHTLLELAISKYSRLHPLAVVIDPRMGVDETVRQVQGIPVYNENPQLGQGTSIRLGVEALLQWEMTQRERLEAIVCSVIDQPLLNVHVIETLCNAFRDIGDEKAIVQPQYGPNQERGNPVVFGRYWADALCMIPGDTGGRMILKGDGASHVRYVWLERQRSIHSGVDIDTKEDYDRIVNEGGRYETNHSHP